MVSGGPGFSSDFSSWKNLLENPWVPNRVPPDHHSCGSRKIQYFAGPSSGGHISVSQRRAVYRFHSELNGIVMYGASVHLLDGSTMDTEKIDFPLVYQLEDRLEVFLIFETNAHLNRENSGNNVSKFAEDAVDLFRLAQQASATSLFVYGRSGAAHIQVDSSDRVFQQLEGRPFEMMDVFSDHLSENRTTRFVLSD